MRRHTAERNIALCTAIALPLVLALSGCTAPAQPPATTPTKSNTTPSQDALFEEASAVVRTIHRETDLAARRGGASTIPDSLKKYVTGKLESNIESALREYQEEKSSMVGGDTQVVWIKSATATRDGSIQTLDVCLDASQSGTQRADGSVSPGGIGIRTYYFKHFDGQLKAFSSHREGATSCQG